MTDTGAPSMKQADTRRVLIVDDDPQMRNGFRAVLDKEDNEFVIVAEASNGSEGVAEYRKHRPDIVLMDLQMPVMTGIEATQEICRKWPDACIVALTTFGTHDYIVAALRAGAAGYLLKDVEEQNLLAAMRQALQGDMPMSSSVRRALVRSIIDEEPVQSSKMVKLTKREKELLHWLAQGLTNQQMAAEMFLSEGSVKQYLNNVSIKMGVKGRTQVLIKAVQMGYVDLTKR